MNLAGLYAKLLTALAESQTPQYWSQQELYDYIDDGQIEFVKRTKILQKTAHLDRNISEVGVYFLPADIIEPISVQYKGRPLDKKNTKYLDAAYSGTSHQQVISGRGNTFSKGWREMSGDPIHWYFDNMFVKVFPRPGAFTTLVDGTIIQRFTTAWYEGQSYIQLPIELPYDKKDSIDVYISGIYQNSQDWQIDPQDNTRILFNEAAAESLVVEIVRQMSAALTIKVSAQVTAGDTIFSWQDCDYDPMRDSVRVVLSGVVQKRLDYSLSSDGTGGINVTLNAPASDDGVIEVTIYTPPTRNDGTNRVVDEDVSMSYVHLPESLLVGLSPSDNTPEIPEAFHNACWQYAAHLALSKEGQKTNDIKKSMVFLERFEGLVNSALRFTDSEIDVDPAVQMPWRL